MAPGCGAPRNIYGARRWFGWCSVRQSGPLSSSSGVMTRADVKALQALEVMKSCHDFDSIVSLESLATIRKRYSIPDEYILHVPGPGQRPYHPCPKGFSISIDALEVGLRFPLHPVIGECLSRRRDWGFGVEWSPHPVSNVTPNLSDEESILVGRLKGILSASQAIRNLTEEWTTWSLPSAQVRPRQSMAGEPDLGRSSVSRTGVSTELPREPLGSMTTEDGLHKGLVRMGVHDVTPPTLQSVSRPCFRSDSVYFLWEKEREPDRAPVGPVGWGALYSLGGGLAVCSALPQVWSPHMVSQSAQGHGTMVWRTMQHLWRAAMVRLAQRPAGSTLDADVALA
ncbi:hypothetical protein BHE74_00019633 [Ensete ventricosum]|nr:hypothetical protein BHE74_00019633 [Ensete ventricosum]